MTDQSERSGEPDGTEEFEKPSKDGLEAAIDVTKLTLAIAGAAIAFLISSDTLKELTGFWTRLEVTFSLLAFGVSAIGGLLVLMQGASNLADQNYDLRHDFLRIPGIVNIVGLISGFFFATLFVVTFVWTRDPP